MNNNGIRTFLTIWIGQLVSQVGTAMTRFALLIWTYQQSGSATSVALLGFFTLLPAIVVSPFAGVWVDRLDRRKVMLLADLGSGLTTATLLALYLTGNLHLWHLYGAQLLSGVFGSFQHPAYAAATTLLLPKEHYARGNGLRSIAGWGATVLAPVLGGVMLLWLGLVGIMLVDLATFGIAAGRFLRPVGWHRTGCRHRPNVPRGLPARWRHVPHGLPLPRPSLCGGGAARPRPSHGASRHSSSLIPIGSVNAITGS
ncbi:MAG: MFS transporter [Chloroflexota bacterium]|nr:MFS transporter [Chloroflexota bacterium]